MTTKNKQNNTDNSNKLSNIGVLQGRLTPTNGRGIQFFPFDEWQNEFSLAKKIGFDSIELLVKKDSFDKNPIWSKDGRNEILELKEKHNINTPSVHGFTLQTENYADVFSQLLEYAHEIDAKTVLVSFFDENVINTSPAKEKAIKRLLKPLKTAEKLGIKLGVETELPANEVKDFIDCFDSASIGVYYDIGNMVSMNCDVVKEIDFLGDLIVGVHVKDRLLNHGVSVPIGEGDTDFKAVIGALTKIGYDGDYIMQGARSDNVDDLVLNSKYRDYILDILKTIKQ